MRHVLIILLICSVVFSPQTMEALFSDTIKPTSTNNSFEETSFPLTTSNSSTNIQLDLKTPSRASTLQSEWFEGCSVNTTFEFPDSFINPESIRYSILSGQDSTYQSAPLVHSYYDDGSYYWEVTSMDDNDDENVQSYTELNIDADKSGTLYYDFYQLLSDVYDDDSDSQSTTVKDSTLEINSTYLLGGGKIAFYFTCRGSASYNYAHFSIMKSTGEWDLIVTSDATPPANYNTSYIKLRVDELRFQPDDIISDYRAFYRYPDTNHPNNKEHKLEIECPDYQTNLTLNCPDWTDSINDILITPSCDFTFSSDNLLLYNTIPTTYDIRILEKDENPFYVALEDRSSDYLTNLGFNDGEWKDTFDDYTSTYLTPTINNSVVYEGAYSLRLEKSSGGAVYLRDENAGESFSSGDYCLSLTYYVESWTDSLSDLFFYYGSASYYTVICSQATVEMNRWHRFFFYFDLIEDIYDYQFYIDRSGSTAVIFLDDIRIWKVSTEVQTTGYSENTITSQFICWDGLQNLPMPYLDVEVDLRDRCDDSSIQTWSKTTDSEGKISILFKGSLEMKEYELRVWSYDSWFCNSGEIGTEFMEDISKWSQGGIGSSDSLSTDSRTGDYSLKFEVNQTAAYYGCYWSSSDKYDISEVDYISFDWKGNVSGTVSQYWFGNDASNRYAFNTIALTTDWVTINKDVDDVVSAGTIDLTQYDYFNIYHVFSASAINYTIYLDSIHFIQASKYFFTPLQCGTIDYFESEEGDMVDFTEGDDEGMTIAWEETNSDNITNGYVEWIKTTDDTSSYIYQTGLSIDTNYFTYLQCRFYVNESNWNFQFYYNTGSLRGIDLGNTNSGWNIITYDLSQESYWTGTNTRIDCRLVENTTNLEIRFDFIQILHKDSDISKGYSWEFEESDFNDGWESYSGGSGSVANGIMKVTSPTTYDGIEITFEETLSHSTYFIMLKARSSTITTDFRVSFVYDSGSEWFPTAQSLSSDWSILHYDPLYFNFYGIRIKNHASQTGSFELAWVRVYKATTVNLYESENFHYTSSENNTLVNYFNQDKIDIGVFNDLVNIAKNESVGLHNISYAVFNDLDQDQAKCYLPSSWYYTIYTIAFTITPHSFYLSDSKCHLYVTSNLDSGSYTILENETIVSSGSFLGSGTTITHNANTTAYFVNVCYQFTDGTNTRQFNTSYSPGVSALDVIHSDLKYHEQLDTFYLEASSNYGDTTIYAWFDTSNPPVTYLTSFNEGVYSFSASSYDYDEYYAKLIVNRTINGMLQSHTVYLSVQKYNIINLNYQGTPANNSNVERNTATQMIDWSSLDEIVDWIIYRNNTEAASGTGVYPYYSWDVSDYSLDTFNFTCWVAGSGGTSNSSTVFLTLVDTIAATLTYTGTTNATNIEAGTDVTISFTISENVSYSLYRNGTLIASGNDGSLLTSWSYSYSWDTDAVTLDQYYNFTLDVIDSGSTNTSAYIQFYVRDTTNPIVSAADTDITFQYSVAENGTIKWSITELHPDTYIITTGGETVASGSYTNGETISYTSVPRDELTTYIYTLTANDTSGNSHYIQIQVTVGQEATHGNLGPDGTDETSMPQTVPPEIQQQAGLGLLIIVLLCTGGLLWWKNRKEGGAGE